LLFSLQDADEQENATDAASLESSSQETYATLSSNQSSGNAHNRSARNSLDQGVSSSPNANSGSKADPFKYHAQVICFMELLLQSFVLKAPTAKQSQVRGGPDCLLQTSTNSC
jgi:hypothetical protein